MRHPRKISLTVLLACATVFAQTNPHEQLQNAFALEQQGDFDEAIAIVKTVTGSNQLGGVELGRACIMLGVAYGVKGNFNEAQAAFERALRILEGDPDGVGDYASALDNYAGLYSDTGQLEIATSMWTKALRLREKTGDHVALLRSFTKLAGVSLAQRRVRDAQQYLDRASAEMRLTRQPIEDDLAALVETQAWLSLAEGNAAAAAAGYGRALEISERVHGPGHWLTGWESMLCGKAYAQSGDMNQALENMRDGLDILDHALGRNNPKYLVAQIAYSQLLDRTGSHSEARRLRAAAEQARKDFYSGQCVGCTMNVNGFRQK